MYGLKKKKGEISTHGLSFVYSLLPRSCFPTKVLLPPRFSSKMRYVMKYGNTRPLFPHNTEMLEPLSGKANKELRTLWT